MSHYTYKEGDKVIVGRHKNLPLIGTQWVREMDEFVGKVATIRGYDAGQSESSGISTYRLDIDHGRWFWREESLQRIIEYPNQRCSSCNTTAPHAEPNRPNKTYMCVFCAAMSELAE